MSTADGLGRPPFLTGSSAVHIATPHEGDGETESHWPHHTPHMSRQTSHVGPRAAQVEHTWPLLIQTYSFARVIGLAFETYAPPLPPLRCGLCGHLGTRDRVRLTLTTSLGTRDRTADVCHDCEAMMMEGIRAAAQHTTIFVHQMQILSRRAIIACTRRSFTGTSRNHGRCEWCFKDSTDVGIIIPQTRPGADICRVLEREDGSVEEQSWSFLICCPCLDNLLVLGVTVRRREAIEGGRRAMLMVATGLPDDLCHEIGLRLASLVDVEQALMSCPEVLSVP